MNYPSGQHFPPGQPSQSPQQPGRNKNLVVLLGGAVALLLVILLVLVIAMVSKDDAPEAASAGVATTGVPSSGTTATKTSTSKAAGITISNRKHLSQAEFKPGATKTALKLTIVRAIDLPPEFDQIGTNDADARSATIELRQRSNRDVIIYIAGTGVDTAIASVGPDGKAKTEINSTDNDLSDFPMALPMMPNTYFHVEAGGGQTIPHVAQGVEPGQVLMRAVKGDAWDQHKVWGIIDGSAKLYELKLEWA